MTVSPAHPSGQDPRATDHAGPASPATTAGAQAATFGDRLRQARQTKGMTLEACAQALRLPARVLRLLESGQAEGADHAVYLASYITTYARFLALDETSVQAAVAQTRAHKEPALVATGGISHSRYLLERYATAATYVVLTAVIVVPMIWLGIRGTLDRDISHLAPLDAVPVAQQDTVAPAPASALHSSTAGAAGALTSGPKAAERTLADDQPLMASMVPSLSVDLAAPARATSAPEVVGTGAHALGLDLGSASWVEVTTANGSRLEYGLLPAGADKVYRSDQPLEVRLGNAAGATVTLDGSSVPLDDYRHANVAHFRVQMNDGRATAVGM